MKRMRRAAMVAATVLIFLSVPAGVMAFPDFVGSRALGMGGAGRADARGGEAPLLNPAGMSLARLYTLEGGYGFINRDGGQVVHASVVDSTSGYNLAGGLFYSYRWAPVAGGGSVTGHEPGLSLSFPFADRVLLGVTAKYVRVSGGPAEFDGQNSHSGVTADVGVIIKPGSMATIAVTGYNLHDLSTVQAPVALGYGLALTPIPDLAIVLDGVHDFTTTDPTRGVITTVGAGGEYVFQRRIAFRAGGGRDGGSRNGYASAGLAAISELGAVDFSFRQDVTGDQKRTMIVASIRLFVPQP